MYLTTKALVLRTVRYKESDLILTLLTEEGKLTAAARRALRKGSRIAAATQVLCWSEFTLFGNRDRWSVNEASTQEEFLGLRENIGNLALASYFSDILECVCMEGQTEAGVLPLALNALYALSRGLFSPEQIKAVFELRLLSLVGFEPQLDRCGLCGNPEPEKPMFCPDLGMVHCADCLPASVLPSEPLDQPALAAMRYIVAAPAKKEFSFALPEESLKRLGTAAEQFVRSQLDREFSSLKYWKAVKQVSPAYPG